MIHIFKEFMYIESNMVIPNKDVVVRYTTGYLVTVFGEFQA